MLGLTDAVALSANEARFFRFREFFGHVLAKTKSVTPKFFFLFGNSTSVPSFKKNCACELLGANFLKGAHYALEIIFNFNSICLRFVV